MGLLIDCFALVCSSVGFLFGLLMWFVDRFVFSFGSVICRFSFVLLMWLLFLGLLISGLPLVCVSVGSALCCLCGGFP